MKILDNSNQSFESFQETLKILSIFLKILQNFERSYENSRKFKKMFWIFSKILSKILKILENSNFWNFSKILKIFRKFSKILSNTSNFQQIYQNLKKFFLKIPRKQERLENKARKHRLQPWNVPWDFLSIQWSSRQRLISRNLPSLLLAWQQVKLLHFCTIYCTALLDNKSALDSEVAQFSSGLLCNIFPLKWNMITRNEHCN